MGGRSRCFAVVCPSVLLIRWERYVLSWTLVPLVARTMKRAGMPAMKPRFPSDGRHCCEAMTSYVLGGDRVKLDAVLRRRLTPEVVLHWRAGIEMGGSPSCKRSQHDLCPTGARQATVHSPLNWDLWCAGKALTVSSDLETKDAIPPAVLASFQTRASLYPEGWEAMAEQNAPDACTGAARAGSQPTNTAAGHVDANASRNAYVTRPHPTRVLSRFEHWAFGPGKYRV